MAKATQSKVKITETALYQRINRKLKHDGKTLRTARSPSVEVTAGRYFIVDVQKNVVSRQDVALEPLGRELGVMHAWEEIEQ